MGCVSIYIYACTYICVSVKFSLRNLSFTEVLVTFDLKNICIYIIYIYIYIYLFIFIYI